MAELVGGDEPLALCGTGGEDGWGMLERPNSFSDLASQVKLLTFQDSEWPSQPHFVGLHQPWTMHNPQNQRICDPIELEWVKLRVRYSMGEYSLFAFSSTHSCVLVACHRGGTTSAPPPSTSTQGFA